MGLLKHVVLPFYATLNLFLLYKCLIAEDINFVLEGWDRDIEAKPITTLEMHLLHVSGGTFGIFLINNVAAIIVENSHYRMMAVLLQVLFFMVDWYSYIRLGSPVPPVIIANVVVGIVGLVVHSKEPGIFTKDKGSEKGKTN